MINFALRHWYFAFLVHLKYFRQKFILLFDLKQNIPWILKIQDYILGSNTRADVKKNKPLWAEILNKHNNCIKGEQCWVLLTIDMHL